MKPIREFSHGNMFSGNVNFRALKCIFWRVRCAVPNRVNASYVGH